MSEKPTPEAKSDYWFEQAEKRIRERYIERKIQESLGALQAWAFLMARLNSRPKEPVNPCPK